MKKATCLLLPLLIFATPILAQELENPCDDEKYLMMSEGRPETMQWLILYPKKK